MKKTAKILCNLFLLIVVVPLVAGWATMSLWNCILTSVCGFASIGLWQGVGLFVLGQILSGGFILGCFLVMGALHHAVGHRRRGDLGSHWHNMTDEERRAFIERRGRFGFRHNHSGNEDVAD